MSKLPYRCAEHAEAELPDRLVRTIRELVDVRGLGEEHLLLRGGRGGRGRLRLFNPSVCQVAPIAAAAGLTTEYGAEVVAELGGRGGERGRRNRVC